MARRNRVIGNVPEDEVVETVEEEEEGEEKMMSSQAEIQVGDEEEEEEEPGTPSPVVMMRHMFFLGCSSGVGVVYAIETTWEREADALVCSLHYLRSILNISIILTYSRHIPTHLSNPVIFPCAP